MEKLISMTDFVLEQMKNTETLKDNFVKTAAYANFLKQHLELWMFVPCDEDGNVLEEPKDYKVWLSAGSAFMNIDEILPCQKYQEAKERCLFEGFEFIESQKKGIELNLNLFISPYNNGGRIYLTKKKSNGFHSWFQLFTIEDLIQCDLILSQNALKQIGL